MGQPREIYAVGAFLSSVRDALGNLNNRRQAAVHYLCGMSLRDLTSGPPQFTPSEAEAVAVQVAIGLLQRGRPTLSSPTVERVLTSRLKSDAGIHITESGADTVEFETEYTGITQRTWQARLIRAHLPLDTRARPDPAITD